MSKLLCPTFFRFCSNFQQIKIFGSASKFLGVECYWTPCNPRSDTTDV